MSYANLIKTLGLANIASATVAVMFAATEAHAAVAVQPAALPSTPVVGALAVDSGDSNKLKWYDGTAWQAAGAGSSVGIAGTAAINQVVVGSGTNTVASSAYLTYNGQRLIVSSASLAEIYLTGPAGAAHAALWFGQDSGSEIYQANASYTPQGAVEQANQFAIYSEKENGIAILLGSTTGNLKVGNYTTGELFRIFNDGGVQIGGTYGTSPGAGVLQLTGNTITTVAANPGGTTTLWVDSANEHLMFGATDLSTGGVPYLAQNEIGFGSSTNGLTSVPGFTLTGYTLQMAFDAGYGGATLAIMQNTNGAGWGGFQAIGEATVLHLASYGSGVGDGYENQPEMPMSNTAVVSSNLRLLVTGSEIYTMTNGLIAARMFAGGGIIFGGWDEINPTDPPPRGVVVAASGFATGPNFELNTSPIWKLGGAYSGSTTTNGYVEITVSGQAVQIPCNIVV